MTKALEDLQAIIGSTSSADPDVEDVRQFIEDVLGDAITLPEPRDQLRDLARHSPGVRAKVEYQLGWGVLTIKQVLAGTRELSASEIASIAALHAEVIG